MSARASARLARGDGEVCVELEQASPESCGADPVRALRVAVVDDNIDAARLLAEMLALEGHEVRVAFDGAGAIPVVLEFEPDVVVLDIGLPSLDGCEVASRLRAAGLRSTLVALTGYGREVDRARAAAAGFDAYLVKPVDYRDLSALLKAARLPHPIQERS